MSNHSEYEKLKAVWYKKLKDEGFQDIETDEDNLKTWSSRFSSKKARELWRAKEAYYYMATNFLNDYSFDSNLEKVIWEYHSNAMSVRNIAKLLNKSTYSKKLSKEAVWLIVRKLEASMKRMYLPSYE